ncbi:sigma-70 family RNA polymerase sigma factor [Kitasatospora sp. NBC_00240]|uniref:sigma-70 family RNA polymerase sigma factor n=1 Tax=Kitasatospora sp. NBC_00240 TaxID=2903567 RepID=UPI002256F26F|nr:sigma-70 family RNA polymerase sigma factor [Kitasatospora sp. NBC_00240]MCX5207755.1 sigma-70 family RNA polymerase sigma factor [Kitasatospora sp. NBC_00240]MCX5215346.1 sigma-70 family RNA polymerase sigma factor [Kitasatospora sp. NBC_00240]MCX5216093.1 sigma-70 family RNA polymerase sigma factor [Kitasatospora sp. NBC_00240]
MPRRPSPSPHHPGAPAPEPAPASAPAPPSGPTPPAGPQAQRPAGAEAPESDERLTARVRAGEEGVVAELYERHHGAATAYARTLTRTAEGAEDLASEAFALTLQAVRSGAGPDQSWRRYLLTVVRNTAVAWSTAQRRTLLTADFGDWADRQDETPTPDELLAAGAEHRLVAAAFGELPERWRTVLWHAVVEQQAPERIAPLLGLTPSGVSSLVSRAREGLREAYLSAHVRRADASPECRAYADRLAALVRRPEQRQPRSLVRHLDGCERCRSCVEEMRDVNRRLRAVGLAAFLPWGGGHDYLAAVSGGAVPAGAAAGAGAPPAGLGAKAVAGKTVAGKTVAGVAAVAVGAVVAAALGASASHPRPAAAPAGGGRAAAAAAPGAASVSPVVAPAQADPVPAVAPTSSGGPTPAVAPTSSGGPATGRATAGARATTGAASRAPAAKGGGLSATISAGTTPAPSQPGDQVVELRFAAQKSCVSVEGYESVEGSAPYFVPCESTTDQRWYLRPGPSGGRLRVVSAGNGGCLRPGSGSGPAVEGTCGSGTKEEWQTVSLGGKDVALRHVDTGQLLGAARDGSDDDVLVLHPATCATDATCKDQVTFLL